jgi:hypothetical protein
LNQILRSGNVVQAESDYAPNLRLILPHNCGIGVRIAGKDIGYCAVNIRSHVFSAQSMHQILVLRDSRDWSLHSLSSTPEAPEFNGQFYEFSSPGKGDKRWMFSMS